MPSLVRPVPTKKTILARKFSKRQIALVNKIKRAGLKPVMYKRATAKTGWSVHNPFLDAKRKARVGFTQYRYNQHPQAWDSPKQAAFAKKYRGKNKLTAAVKKARAGGKKKKGFLDIFVP